MKAAIYCRVSTPEQDATIQSKICTEYCTRTGIEIYHVFTDSGVSGKFASRPQWNSLLTDMRQMKFNAIVFTKLDRIGRSLQNLLSLFDEFNRKGINVIAVEQNIDTASAAGRLQTQIIGAFAEYERELISERTKDGLRYAKNVGKRGKDKQPRLKRGGLRKPTIYDEDK